jgi:hypothetical protein
MPRPFLPLTLAQFEQLVDSTPLTRRIDSVHMHHTWRPNHAQYRGLRSIESMWEYHTRENGWSDIAQHISIGPEGTIWTGRDWNRPPASATGFNGSETSGPFMFEIIGDFDRGADPLVGTQLQAVLGVIAALMKKHGLALQSLRFHNEMTDAKSCPGSSLDKDTILKGVAALLSKPAAKPAVPRAPSADPLIADARALVAAAIPRTARTGEDSSAGLDCHIDYPSWELASKLGSRSGESPDFQSLRPHLVNLRHGKYSNDGQVGTTAADIDALFKQHLPDAISRLPAGSKLPLMLYAHGGLVKEKVALAGAAAQIPRWNANGVYPLFFIWETGLLETLGQMIEAALGSFWKRLGGGRSLDTLPRGDLFIDPAVEKAARRIGGVKIWGAMKESARKAFSQGGDGLHFIRALADFLKSHGNQVSLQAIGHSAGSIWHAYLIDALLNRRPATTLDSLSLLAPAIRCDLFSSHLLPHLGTAIKSLPVFTMSDDHERDDECAKVYRKSLLYLIHHALEEDHEAQLLGMERCLRADHTLAKAFGLTGIRSAGEVVWSICNDGPRHASASTSHGGFDNDPATMESVCRRILRKDAIVKFPPAARSFADLAGPDDTELEILGLLAGAGQQSGNFPAGPAVIVKPGPAAAKRRGHHALCIGIDNYPNPASRLSGCVADARLWANVLAARGFSVTTLVDADAHRDAMIQAIAALLDEAEPGDVRVIQYSGHGTHVEDLDGDEKTDRGPGRDEALCCFDYARGNLLIDDDLAQIVARVPAGVNITFFMDCCHSGTNTRFAAPSVNQAADDKRVARHVTLTDEEMARYRTARGTPPARGARGMSTVTRSGDPYAGAAEVLFSGCQPGELSYERDGHGIFTLSATRVLAECPPGTSHEAYHQRVLELMRGEARPVRTPASTATPPSPRAPCLQPSPDHPALRSPQPETGPMNLPDKVGSITWLPNLSILLAVSLGIFVSEPPLATDRVMTGSEKTTTQSGEAVGLNYLWEDPYTPIADLDQAAIDKLPPLKSLVTDEDLVLFVGMEGSPRGGATENRTRTRNAISSVIAGRAEMMPERPVVAQDRRSQLQTCRIRVGEVNYPVVCEHFNDVNVNRNRWFDLPYKSVAVVYVDELRLQPTPASLRWMVASAKTDLSPEAPRSGQDLPYPGDITKDMGPLQEGTAASAAVRGEFCYLGLCRSSTLTAFFSPPDLRTGLPKVHFVDIRLRLYSPFASIENDLLHEQITDYLKSDRSRLDWFTRNCPDPVPATWSDSLSIPPNGRPADGFSIHLERIGADDGTLCRGLVKELSERGIAVRPQDAPTKGKAPRDAVLLLADMDNLHSKMLVESFRRASLGNSERWQQEGRSTRIEKQVRVIHYPEALDGLLSGPEASTTSPPAVSSGTNLPASLRPANIHPAEGASQYDALRRLPERLRQLEKDDGVRYRAVGFFGSDPHDKILLMRALRNSFAETLFFTNDLDALFWQGRDRSCAQNLVVSTAFGLSLDGTLQGSIPPFRSSVQTSTYLAVLQAIRFGPNNLKNDPASKLRWPRRDVEIYEIGRKGPHLLAFWNHQDHSLQGVSPGRVAITGPKRIEQGVHLLVIGLSALVLSACIWFTTRFNRRIWKGRQFRWIPRISQAVVLTAAGICLWYGWRSPEAHELAAAEPRVWLSGISGIPVIIGNTMSVALASTLLFLGIRRLALNMREVKNAYPFGGYRSGDRRQPHEIRAYRSHGFLRYPSPWDITGWLVILSHAKPPHFRALAKRLGKPFGRHRKADYDSAAPLLQQQRIVHFLGRSPESRLVDSFAREGLATSLSNRLIRILVGLVALLTLYRVLSGSQLPNTLAPPFLRGAGERTAFQYSDMAAKIALVVSCCFVIDTQLRLGLSLAKFGRFLRDRGTRKSSPYLHGHRMDLPDDLLPERPRLSGWLSPLKPFDDPRDIGLWELPLVEIAASRFRASAPAVGIPFTLLFILLVTRYSVFEGVSYPAGEMIFFVTAMSLPLITGAFAQFQMRAIFVAASARLRRAKAIHTGKIGSSAKSVGELWFG